MRKFKLINSLYFLPVFFFTLAISPNINGDRIGIVLLSVFILLIPAANYLAANPGKRVSDTGNVKYSFRDSLALIMIIVAIYLGWNISWQLSLLQGLYLFAVVLISPQQSYLSPDIKWFISKAFQATILFAIIYLGLNHYGFSNLLRTHIALFASLSTLIIITGLYLANFRAYYLGHQHNLEALLRNNLRSIRMIWTLLVLLVLAFGGFFITTYHWHYAGYFVLAVSPSLALTISLQRQVYSAKKNQLPRVLIWLNITLSICLTIFFIYFFLDSTQVLQAIRGGY